MSLATKNKGHLLLSEILCKYKLKNPTTGCQKPFKTKKSTLFFKQVWNLYKYKKFVLFSTLVCLIVGRSGGEEAGGGGRIKCTKVGEGVVELSRFYKVGRVYLVHSLIIIKWTWGFFSQNLQFNPPFLQLGTKE